MKGLIASKIQKKPYSNKIDIGTSVKKYYQIYLILLPAVIFYFLISYLPMYGITMAFREYRFDKGLFFSPFIGFKYFEKFFTYFQFWQLIRNTLVISFFKLVLYFPIPIIFALMLNELRYTRLKKIIQTISYLPNFISWVVAVLIFQQFLSMDGFINQIRGQVGLESIHFMSDASYFYPIMFISYIWKNVGFGAIIYLAAIAGVDPSLYESAVIDGAGKLKQIWYITLPSIAQTAVILFILALGSVLNAGFDQIYLLRTPGNMEVSDILDTYIIQNGMKNGEFGYATAVSLFQSVIGLILVLITNKIAKKVSEISLF